MLVDVVVAGLIPARAGNTGGENRFCVSLRAHPRSRGEHQGEEYKDICAWGSSPLARGTQSGTLSALGAQGLIPARAGNTSVLIGWKP